MQGKNWIFVLNNYTPQDEEDIKTWPFKYLIYGKEVGESGTPHLQGYAQFKKILRLSALKKLHGTCHFERAKGDYESNIVYCSKDEIVTEYGERPIEKGEQEKLRWTRARSAAMSGDLTDVPDDIFVRCYNTLKCISKDYAPMPSDATDVTGVWICGEAGVGKSRKAREDYPDFYYKQCNKWWDGYKGEPVALIGQGVVFNSAGFAQGLQKLI